MTKLIQTSQLPLTLTGYPTEAPYVPDGTATAGDLWRILWHRRGLITLIVVACASAAVCYASVTPPRYKASAEILIDPVDRMLSGDTSTSTIGPDGGVAQVETQTQVIGSASVLLRAIAATDLTNDPDFNGKAEQGWSKWLSNLRPHPAPTDAEASATTLRTLQAAVATKRADRVFVVEVVVTALSPEKAARVANAIADAYLDDRAAARADVLKRTMVSLSAGLDYQRERVEQAEQALQDYKVAHKLFAVSGQPISEQRLGDLNVQLGAARAKIETLRAQLDELEQMRQLGTTAMTAEVLQSPVIGKLREQEASLEQHRAELEARLGRSHPSVVAAQSQLTNVRLLVSAEAARILGSVKADYERAKTSEALLSRSFERQQGDSTATAEASLHLHQLERDLDARKSVYAAYMVREHEMRGQIGIDIANARVITRAVPPVQKSWPPIGLLLAGAIGFGLGSGGGVALIGEYVRPTILSKAQVERVTGAPVIGSVPAVVRSSARRWRRPANTAEARRMLNAMALILARLFDREAGPPERNVVRSILITSGPREAQARGRVCRLIASAAVMRGERALLIDADFTGGQPGAGPGLLDILHGESRLESVVEHGASLGTALVGKGRDHATLPRADAKSWVKRMLSEARGQFDIAIIDGGVPSENLPVALLAEAVDAVLLVAQLSATSESDVAAVADTLAIMGGPVTAVLLVDAAA